MTVVLVEGASDRAAVQVLAARRGVDLAGVEVVAMAGITNLPAQLRARDGQRVLVLYDAAEHGYVARVMARLGRLGTPAALFACEADLEDELIGALGHPRVLAVIEAAGELASYELLRRQPARRDRSERENLRRFLSSHSGRKLRYAGLLVEALDLSEVPAPLDALLDAVVAPGGRLDPWSGA